MLISIATVQLFILVFTRVTVILVQIPIFGGSMVNNWVKVGLGVSISLLIYPVEQLLAYSNELPIIAYMFAIFQEILIGFLAGFAASLLFNMIQIAATIMELSSGFSAGSIFNPTIGAPGSAFNQFFVLFSMMYFLVINAHHTFLQGLWYSFIVLPIGSSLELLSPGSLLLLSGKIITSGVQIALPVMGALLLTDLTMGLLARVSPQINVFFLGLPVKVWVGVVGLFMAIIVLTPVIRDIFGKVDSDMIQILGL
ncbi:MAG: flagellar biosynthetic protein FliR [Anaerolineaceae bacterium]|nr:flagellar biosynthetic protein FliR [Anaerolineaceae bacterium]